MLLILLFYLLISITCISSGYLLVHWRVDSDQRHRERKHWIVYACWGVIGITGIGQLVQLFTLLNHWHGLLLLLLSSFIVFFRRETIFKDITHLRSSGRSDLTFLFIVLTVIIFIALFNAGPTMMDDTESYHIQMIKWIQEYGTVPGLANLHERYGFNSSWFTYIAFFVPSPVKYNFYTVTNGLVSVWLAIYLLQNIWKQQKSQNKPEGFVSISSFIILVIALLTWPMIRGNATTSNYDFISAVMILVLCIELLKAGNNWGQLLPELFLWPVFLFTVRIVNYPFLIITAFACLHYLRNKHLRTAGIMTMLSLSFVIPFLIRNVVLSGYLFYPAYQLDFFNPDWKADKQLAKEIMEFIKYFNRVNAGFLPTYETAKLETPQWIPLWFKYLFPYDRPVLFLGGAGLLISLLHIKKWKMLAVPLKVFIMACILQMISWFVVAPDPRFVYGPLLAGTVLLCYNLLPEHSFRYQAKILRLAAGVTAMLLLASGAIKYLRDKNYQNPVTPVILPIPETALIEIDGVRFRIPEKLPGNWNPRCYATSLPCLYNIQPGLRLRGNDISKGFKVDRSPKTAY